MEKIIADLEAAVQYLREQKNPSPHQNVLVALLNSGITRAKQHLADVAVKEKATAEAFDAIAKSGNAGFPLRQPEKPAAPGTAGAPSANPAPEKPA